MPDANLGCAEDVRKYSQTGGVKKMNAYRFLVVVEKAGQNYSAYSPDLPGCVATGGTREDAEKNMADAIQMHIEGLKEDGLPIPSSTSTAEYLVVSG
jgi:predicted RNase H-like HicB family nuclease